MRTALRMLWEAREEEHRRLPPKPPHATPRSRTSCGTVQTDTHIHVDANFGIFFISFVLLSDLFKLRLS